ncbi:MAG: nicotinate-nucleotide--dimethylbenzimidazole phosphoribosyltransferase [Clostridiales bacterium]|nr:nicotinate-nucleotide--dimethylbenzimidazole phosphoribosyltransferase [Clostridiales bacterium]
MNIKMDIRETVNSISPLYPDAMAKAREHQDMLAKPPGSLGRLEELSVQLAGITGKVNNEINKKTLLVFCADNGVVEEGVASAPQSVTLAQTINLTRKKTGAAVLADHTGCEIKVFDMGVNADITDSNVADRKIRKGTSNIMKGPAMTREEAEKAITTGISEAVAAAKESGVLGIGEMGIGNTTTSSAVLAVLTGKPVKELTGRGAGITDDAYDKKIKTIETAIEINRPDRDDVIDVIAKVGGFDIAAMTGAFLGAAAARCPVVIDGFISAVAALCAARICPVARDYFIPSHASFEIGYRIAMGELDLRPLFDLDMRLGEGSGCPIAMQILEDACAVMNNMATFEEAEINDDYLEPIRSSDSFTVR